MGKKTVAFIGGLALMSAIFMVVGATWPTHRVSFYTLFILQAVRIQTTLLSVYIDPKDSEFCRIFNEIQSGFCDSIEGNHDLQGVSQRFCSPMIEKVYPQACHGLTNAYIMGLITTFMMAINIILVLSATWLLYQYAYGSFKQQYRKWGLALMAGATGLYAVTLMSYGLIVLLPLDDMTPRLNAIATIVFTPNRGSGVSVGYLTQWIAVLIQTAMIVLCNFVRSSEEQSVEERKLMKEALAEESGQTGGDSQQCYGAQPHGGHGVAGYGQGYGAAGYGQGYGQQTYTVPVSQGPVVLQSPMVVQSTFVPTRAPPTPVYTETVVQNVGYQQGPSPQTSNPQAQRPAW